MKKTIGAILGGIGGSGIATAICCFAFAIASMPYSHNQPLYFLAGLACGTVGGIAGARVGLELGE